jgi:transport and Golgi organization protein 2
MCTLSFIARANGYLIGMNRDERRTRQLAILPQATGAGTLEAVYPREDGGGTWIAANAVGISFALLNRNSRPGSGAKLRTRGEVIPAVLESASVEEAAAILQHMDLRGMFPFRMIGFFPREATLAQWNWDSSRLELFKLPWQARHWFSSGISDELAREVRGLTCSTAWRHRNAGSDEWLRQLHSSHVPARGSFSVCMHRPDAATVSYTEIACEATTITMRYHQGHPCQEPGKFHAEVTLRAPSAAAVAAAS